MIKNVLLIFIMTLTSLCAYAESPLYRYSVKDLNNKNVSFSKYKNKTLLIVNTATGCGYTPQLKEMQQLAKKYEISDFEVLGFPSNSFKQEDLAGEKIKKFCFLHYGAKFTLFKKSEVKGEKINPVFKYLVENSKRPKESVAWNFEKFVVGPSGKVLGRFKSNVKPNDKRITDLIDKNLK